MGEIGELVKTYGFDMETPFPVEEYQERVVAERSELAEKIDKLSDFIMATKLDTLTDGEADRLVRQLILMLKYSNVLGERIAAFKD